MLIDFRIVNFRSIADLTVDFAFGEKRAPNGYRNQDRMPFVEEGTARAVPCLALFGANAAGKSNIIRAVRVFIEMVRSKKVDVRRLYDPNRIVTGLGATRFEIGCARGGHRYRYAVEYTGEGLVAERLTVDGETLFAIDGVTRDFSGLGNGVFYDPAKLENIRAVECCDADGSMIYPILPILGHDYGGLNDTLSAAYRAFAGGIAVFFDDFGPQMLPVAIDMMVTTLGVSREAALGRVVEVVRKLDVDVLSLEIIEHGGAQFDPKLRPYDLVRHENPTGRDFGISIHSGHRNDRGEEVIFRFLECESEGTKRLAVVVAVILHALALGATVFFDEFDRALHPLLVRELLSLFQKRLYNPHGAQLCFATHCTDILDDSVLRMSEIGIVTKNIRTGTLLRRLTDVKYGGNEIRNVTNFRKQYLEGFYAGIPYPAL